LVISRFAFACIDEDGRKLQREITNTSTDMRLLQISAGPSPLKDTANTYLDTLPEALAARGHGVTALHMAEAGSWRGGLRVVRQDGVVPTVSIWNSGVYAGIPPGAGGIGIAKPRKDIVPPAKLRRIFAGLLDEIQPEIIHLQNLFGFPIRLLEEATKRGIPVAMTEHGFNPICPTVHLFLENGEPCNLQPDCLVCHRCSRRAVSYPMFRFERACNVLLSRVKNRRGLWIFLSWFKTAVLRLSTSLRSTVQTRSGYLRRYNEMCEMLRNLDLLHCISEVQAARLQKATGPLKNLIVRPLVPPTVRRVAPVSRFATSDAQVPTFVVLNIFPSRDDKGWTYLQRVLTLLEQHRSDFRVIWYAEASTHHRCVEYRGRYSHADLDSIAASADACIMPSLWLETLGFTGVELLARGVPLICSDRCGVSQFVRNGVTGVIFEPSTEDNLLQILSDLLDQPSTLERMRRAQAEACARMQTFDEHVDEFAGMLGALVSARGVASTSGASPQLQQTFIAL
jgi:glycosyltransferase involved in cell wall biosynthesis